jgi:hypothetical protein
MQIYAQYVFALRRIDPVTNAIAAKKEKQMGGASTEQSKLWQKGECAYNRAIYGEQMGWITIAPSPTPWAVLPGLPRRGSGTLPFSTASLLLPIPGLVPGFIPPPGWRLSYEQFSGLQAHGTIASDEVWGGMMPLPAMLNPALSGIGFGQVPVGDLISGHATMFGNERLNFLHVPADGERSTQSDAQELHNGSFRAVDRTDGLMKQSVVSASEVNSRSRVSRRKAEVAKSNGSGESS